MSGSNIALREWESVGPEDPLRGHVLKGIRLREEDRDLARALTNSGALEILELADGLLLRARAHVGRIKLGALTITVAPKIGDGELLALFRYAHGLSDLKRLGAASYSLTGGLFQDLIIAQLHAEVRMLLERGIVRTYVGRSDDINSPRGKIDFARLAARGGAVEATLPCRHYPRSSDNLLNRTLLGGLTLAQRMAQDAALSRDVGRLTHRRLGRAKRAESPAK